MQGGVGDAERAVRDYLQFLDDPAKLVDEAETARLEQQLAGETDPIAKLRVVTELRRVRQADEDALRQAFSAHARSWAEANGIPVSSFRELGVDEATLRAAGFAVLDPRRPRRGAGRRGTTTVEQVKVSALGQRGTFTLADVAAVCGGSPMTVRKAINELIAGGRVERLGPTPGWSQPGRAPIQFRVVGKRGTR